MLGSKQQGLGSVLTQSLSVRISVTGERGHRDKYLQLRRPASSSTRQGGK